MSTMNENVSRSLAMNSRYGITLYIIIFTASPTRWIIGVAFRIIHWIADLICLWLWCCSDKKITTAAKKTISRFIIKNPLFSNCWILEHIKTTANCSEWKDEFEIRSYKHFLLPPKTWEFVNSSSILALPAALESKSGPNRIDGRHQWSSLISSLKVGKLYWAAESAWWLSRHSVSIPLNCKGNYYCLAWIEKSFVSPIPSSEISLALQKVKAL